MRSLILSFLFVAISIVSYAQTFELCTDAESTPAMLTTFPSTQTITIDPTWVSDVDYIPPTVPAGALSVAYYGFTVNASDYYNLDFQTPAVNTITSDVSIGMATSCPIDASVSEVYSGMLMTGTTVNGGCTYLTAGTTYIIAIAVNQGMEGDVEFTIASSPGATNEDCPTSTAMSVGPNTGNNTCSDGLVWYSYVVTNGGSVSITPSVSATGTDITSPVISQVILGDGVSSAVDCSNTPETAGTTSWTCLAPGTVIYFEAGDDMAPVEQGNFTITIVDDASGVMNETCADVMAAPIPAPTCMTTELTTGTTNTTLGACPDNYAGCTTFETESTVWFSFSTTADAQTVDIEITNGSISGAEFALIDAAAGCPTMGAPATAIGGCQTGVTLLGEPITGGNTYYIAVSTAAFGTDGTFTLEVTPNNPPLNDVCATGAIDISATAAAGVDGTTACASGDINNLCAPALTDHVVYYTYTVDASITTNRTVTITTGGAVVPVTGTDATGLGLGVFADCLGSPATMPSGANLLAIAGTDLCDALTGDKVFECVEPGTSFTIAVASENNLEGDFNIMITEMETGAATNDVCDLGNNPDITTVTSGTNFCADGELSFCGMTTTADHQVWYQYTNNTGANVDLGLTFTSAAINSATDLSMVVLVGDCNDDVFPGTTDADYCGILDAGEQVISCIEDGETISILLGSAEDPTVMGPEGNFDIAHMVYSTAPANDECTGAVDITPPNTCEWVTVSTLTPLVTAENACPEDFMTFPAGCDFTTESTVWYSITVPNDGATYTLDIQNIANDAFLTVFESTGADCDTYGTPSISADCESGAGPHGAAYDNLTNGSTYFIAVGDPTEAGGFDFEIKLDMLPANDECADAVTLTSGTPTDGTTSCATLETPPYNTAVCTPADEENTVWYTFTVDPGNKGFNLTVTGNGVNPIAAGTSVNAVLFETAACVTDGTTLEDEVCLMAGTLSMDFECVGPGTYTLRISTSDLNAGDFSILFEQIVLDQPNDNCDAPDVSLNPGLDCTWQVATANTVGACPEDMNLDPTACGLSTGSVVWYEITAPANADFLDLQINSDGGANPFISVFPGNPADCDNQTFLAGSTCYQGIFTDLVALGETLIPVTGGSTYLVAVGVTDLVGASFEFGIKWITPPDNDECIDAITLAGNTPTDGTTACATSETVAYNSAVCTDTDETNTVWYEYEVPATDKGFNVTITTAAVGGLVGDVNLVVFESDPGACDVTNATMVDEICTSSTVVNMEFECVGPGTYTIRVSTSSANEGGFSITIEPLAIVATNDFCDAPDVAAFAAQLECEWMLTDASTVDACPEDTNLDPTDCGIDDFPVVWYEVTAPANAEFLDLQIITGGVNPFIAVYEPGPDCDNLNFVAGSTCYSGTFSDLNDNGGQAQVDIVPGNTYLIAVGTDALAGGIINFGIKWITPPDNDECVDAIALTPNIAGANAGEFTTGPIMGTTQCATEALTGSACDDDKTNTVWYEYTVETDVKEITIDVTNWVNTVTGGLPNFSVAVLDGCPPGAAIINQVDGSAADYCGGEGVDLITLSCLDEGDVITILVSSSADNEGTFDITLNTAMPNCTYTNDDCINAEALMPLPIDTDEDCTITAGCNDLACSDFDFTACAGIDQLNAVFYTFTTDADADEAFVNIEILNGEAGELDNPGAVLFNGDCVTPLSIGACGAGAGGEYNSGPLGGPGLIFANTTYTVMVFNSNADQNGGTFDLCVTVSSGCVNDLCADAFTLEAGITVTNPATSENCTPDLSISGCTPDLDEATLWYQVEVPEGFSYFEITLVNGGVPDGVGDGLGEVSIAVGPLDDCNAVVAADAIYTDCTGFSTNGGVHIVDCAVEFGTYYIQIGSADELDAGDFEITFTPQDDADPANDLCSQALDAQVNTYCEFVPFDGDLKGACPEINDVNACLFSENSAVWYKITIPTGDPMISDMDLMVEGLGNPIIGVYEYDCTQAGMPNMGIINTPNLGDGTPAGCVEMDLAEGIVVTPGTEYYILVSSSTNEQIVFTLNIKLNAPPENDDPCITAINPPLDLTGGGSHSGTTCCARGPKDLNPDGTAADFENVECSAATEDAAVWYMYTPSEEDDGYNIILEPGDAEGPTSLEYYSGPPNGGCTGNLTLLGASCNSNSADIKIGNCFEPGEVLYVKVTTDDPDENCGTFILTIIPASCGPMADDCIDTAEEEPILPVTNEEFQIDYTCGTYCLDFACPEDDAMGGCGAFTEAPTVWFQVTIDELAAQMFTTVEANGNWDPVWSIWSGTSCDDLEIVNFGGAPPCSDGDNTPELHQVGVFTDVPNYWIAVTADPNSIPDEGIDDGSFELCVATTITAIICLGEEVGDCDDPSLVMEITDREIMDQPLEGPFCQGEEVTINISFFYDASESGADWLIGFVPIFGEGWDLENFDYAANAPVGNGMTAEWYEEGSDIAPIIQEPNPILCTFVNMDGELTLCNQLCDPCSDCPEQGMMEGDPLPSGYFWVTNGGNAGCDNDGSPGEGWGIGSVQSQIDWTFTLTVKEFESFDDCFENKDLSISFQTFSDGVGGCWEDPVGECILDRAMFSPAWEVECGAPPAVEGPDQELCHDGVTDILVQTEDGSTTQIQVDVVDNPNVTGENSYTFDGGSGTIMDDLTNLTNVVQEVIYMVYSVDETLPCPGVVNEIVVTIYPELVATFPPVYVCEGDCTDITPDIFGGVGVPYTYNWSTGENTPSINVCPVVPTTYFVTVTDGLGCEDVADVQVDVKPPVELLLPESIDVCKDDNFDPFNPDYMVCLDFLSGSSPYAMTWTAEPGLVGEPAGFSGECYTINELASSEFGGANGDGSYVLEVQVTDFFGCMGNTSMIVNITGELIVVTDILDLECGDTEAIINVTGFDATANPVPNFFLYGGCPDDDLGTFIEQGTSSSGTYTFSAVDLLSYTCFTVVAQTESGCQTTVDIEIPLTVGTPIEISGTPEVCIGEEATLTIDNASAYSNFVWTPDIGTTGEVMFTPDTTATYFVEATDATGCVSQEVFTVTVNELPNVGMSGTVTFCEGSSATVVATGGVNYTWSNGGVTGDTYTSSTADETVTVTVEDANGCSSDSTITFTQENIITIELGDQNICDGIGDTVFISSNFVNVSWIDEATSTEVSDTTFYIISGAGTFSVSAQDGPMGCDAMGSFTVMDFMTPMLTVTDTVEVCREDSGVDSLCVNFNNQVMGAVGTWNQDDVIPGFTFTDFTLDNVCFEDIQAGCYPFTYTTTTAEDPCEDVFATMMVCVKACPCPSPATQDIGPFCNLGTVNLENAEITTDPGTWSVVSGPATQDISGLISGTSVFEVGGILAGEYTLMFTLDNPGGGICEESSMIMITIEEPATITAMDEVLCNIEGQADPTSVDLYDLISVDATDGGTWMQISGNDITLSGPDGSVAASSELVTFPQTLVWEYTSGVQAGAVCPPTTVEVSILFRDCNCDFVFVSPDTLCNNGLPINLDGLLENPGNHAGTWSTDGTLVGVNMFDPNGLPSGQYTITYTLNSSIGPNCPLAYEGTILVRRQSVAEPQAAAPPCSIDTGNGPTTSNLYDWLVPGYSSGTWTQIGGDNISFTDNGLDMAVVDFATQDIGEMFTFTFTTNDAEDPCSNVSVDVVITVADCECPPISLDPPAIVCNDDDMIDLCALTGDSDPGSFEVTSLNGLTSYPERITGCMFDVTGLIAGTYNLIFTLDQTVTGTCTQSMTVTFDVVNYLSVTGTESVSVCSDPDGNGETCTNFTMHVSNAAAGVWADVDGAGVAIGTLAEQQNVCFDGVPNGDYTFTYTIDNADPCEDFVHTLVVSVTDDCNCPPINLGAPADICYTDGPLDLTQYDDVNNPGTWSSTELTIENGNSLVIDGVTAGTYTLTYTITNPLPDCPTTDEAMILIGEPANPGTAAEDYRLCEGVNEVVILDDLLNDEDAGGTWSTTAGGLVGNEFTTDGQVAGMYTFTYTIAGNAPCPDVSEDIRIIIDPNPTADAGTEKFIDCENTTADIGGPGTSTGADFIYNWTHTELAIEVGTDANLTVTDAGTYELLVTNTVTGCTAVSQVVVNKSDDLPTMVVTPQDISCFGENDGLIIITDQDGGDGNYTYSLDGATATADPTSFTSILAGEHMITIMDGIGCEQTYFFEIVEPTEVTVEIAADGLSNGIIKGELGDEFTLTIDPVGETVDSISWSDFSNSETIFCTGGVECTSITLSPEDNTTVVYVEVFDANGCTAVDQVQLQLNQIVDVTFPNVISPNGDGNNDYFFVNSDDVKTILSLKIFDRWGEKIYEGFDLDPRVENKDNGWDGKFNDKAVVPGVYVFTTEILFIDDTTEEFSGDITVTDTE